MTGKVVPSRASNRHNPIEVPAVDTEDPEANQRRRVFCACVYCRQRKIRCSGEEGGCKVCRAKRIDCVYTAVSAEDNAAAKSRKQQSKKAAKSALARQRGLSNALVPSKVPPASPQSSLASPSPSPALSNYAIPVPADPQPFIFSDLAPAKPSAYPQPMFYASAGYMQPDPVFDYLAAAQGYASRPAFLYQPPAYTRAPYQRWQEEAESGAESPANSTDETYSLVSGRSTGSIDASPYAIQALVNTYNEPTAAWPSYFPPTAQPMPPQPQSTQPFPAYPPQVYYPPFDGALYSSIALSEVCPPP